MRSTRPPKAGCPHILTTRAAAPGSLRVADERLGPQAGACAGTSDDQRASRTGPGGPSLEIVALGGLGEFGMNMLAVSCGETTIVIDAGVDVPRARAARRRPHHPGPHLPAAERRVSALVLTHGHEDHIGGVPHVLPLVDGPVYGTPLTLALRRAEARGARHRPGDARSIAVRPRDRVTVGPFTIEFIRVTHSMPDCVALAIHTPVGVDRPHRRLQDRPDAARRRALRRPPLRRARHRRACSRCSPTARTSIAAASPDRSSRSIDAFEEIFTSAPGQARRRDVLVEHLPDADPGRPRRAVRSQGRVRRPRHDRELADRAAPRLPATSRPACRSATPTSGSPAAGRALPRHRLAGRAAWRRCRASPSTITGT